jgi:transcriptional regulator with XRE-family HTH domain
MILDMSFGTNLRKARTMRGLTQAQLGKTLGVSEQAVSQWEQDKTFPSFEHLPLLAQKLDTTEAALRGDAPTFKLASVKNPDEAGIRVFITHRREDDTFVLELYRRMADSLALATKVAASQEDIEQLIETLQAALQHQRKDP